MLYAICGNRINLLTEEEADHRIARYALPDLNYLSGESYGGLFALPVYIRRVLEVG
jgi:hypothetical protein